MNCHFSVKILSGTRVSNSMADLFGEPEAELGHSDISLNVNKEYAKRFKVGDKLRFNWLARLALTLIAFHVGCSTTRRGRTFTACKTSILDK